MQALPEVLCERVEIDVFERYAHSIVAVVSSTAFGLADVLPIGSLVANPTEMLALDKSFQQVNGVSVFLYPVGTDAFGDASENMTSQMGNPDPGKDQETHVIGNERQIAFAGLGIPADEGISW